VVHVKKSAGVSLRDVNFLSGVIISGLPNSFYLKEDTGPPCSYALMRAGDRNGDCRREDMVLLALRGNPLRSVVVRWRGNGSNWLSSYSGCQLS
jgi:hypothetical protein